MSKYTQKIGTEYKPLSETYATIDSDGILLDLCYVSGSKNNLKFKLSDYGFEGDNTEFLNANALSTAQPVWGNPASSYPTSNQYYPKYYSNESVLPFVDKYSIPSFLKSDNTGVTLPNDSSLSSAVFNTLTGGKLKFIPNLQTRRKIILEYSTETSTLNIINYNSQLGKETSRDSIKCSPHILVAIQGAGGRGGTAKYASGSGAVPWSDNQNGGGGGSGGFIVALLNLKNLPGNSAEIVGSDSYITFKISGSTYATINHGSNGSDGTSGGAAGGSGGRVSYITESEIPQDIRQGLDIVYVKDGVAGGSGSSDKYNILEQATVSSNYANHNICLVDDAENVPFHCYGMTTTVSAGNYYSNSSGELSSYHAAGGGAPSLMSNGNSGKIGSGGYGGQHVGVSTKYDPQSGGVNAVYISYMPIN